MVSLHLLIMTTLINFIGRCQGWFIILPLS